MDLDTAQNSAHYVMAHDTDTGELWEVCVRGHATPEDALSTALRRKTWAEFLISGHKFEFGVSSEPNKVIKRAKKVTFTKPALAGVESSSAAEYVDFEKLTEMIEPLTTGTLDRLDANSGLRSISIGVRMIDAALK
jgi:hypothetical protein